MKLVRTRYVLGVKSTYFVCTSTYSYKSNPHFISGTITLAAVTSLLPTLRCWRKPGRTWDSLGLLCASDCLLFFGIPEYVLACIIFIAPSHPTRRLPSCYAHTTRAPAPPIPSGRGDVPGIVLKLFKVQPTWGSKEWRCFFGRLKGKHLARIKTSILLGFRRLMSKYIHNPSNSLHKPVNHQTIRVHTKHQW